MKISGDMSHTFPLRELEILAGNIAQAPNILMNSSRIYQESELILAVRKLVSLIYKHNTICLLCYCMSIEFVSKLLD